MVITEKNTDIVLAVDPKEVEEQEFLLLNKDTNVAYVKQYINVYNKGKKEAFEGDLAKEWRYTPEKGYYLPPPPEPAEEKDKI